MVTFIVYYLYIDYINSCMDWMRKRQGIANDAPNDSLAFLLSL